MVEYIGISMEINEFEKVCEWVEAKMEKTAAHVGLLSEGSCSR